MVLSIGMIVKNEEKYLDRCLTALKPILEQVDSELIIVDTGSADRTVEIAKKFTDNVFYFEWINDFAAARNSTLDRAKGEWYMFIDADEIILDCSDIIRFFNSGEYKKYNSALITIRNLADLSRPDVFTEFRSPRLTAIKNGIRFVNPVHEVFALTMPPTKNLKLIFEHYGYIFTDNGVVTELAHQKVKRNLELLMEELAQQKANGKITNEMLCQQISDCYASIEEEDKAIEYLKEGMATVNPKSISIIGYYSKMIRALLRTKRYEDVIELCEKYFSKANAARTQPLVTDCIAYFSRAKSYFMLKDYEKVMPDLAIAFDMYENYINNKFITPELTANVISINTLQLKQYCDILCECCEKTGRYKEAVEILNKFPIEMCFSDQEYMGRHLAQRAIVTEHIGFSALMGLFGRLDGNNKQLFVCVMLWHMFESYKPEQVISELKKLYENSEQKTLTENGGRLAGIIKIYERFFVTKNLTLEEISDFIDIYGTAGNENVWGIMMMKGYDIAPFITHYDFSPEKSERIIFQTYPKAADLFAGYDIDGISGEAIEKAAEVYLFSLADAHRFNGDIVRLFEKFGELGAKWIENNPQPRNVPYYISMAITANNAVIAQKNGDMGRCRELLDEIVKTHPSLEPVILDYMIKTSSLSVKFKLDIQGLRQRGAGVTVQDSVKVETKKPAEPKPAAPPQTGKFKVNTNALSRLKNLSAPEQSVKVEAPAQKTSAPKPKTEFELLAEQFKQNIRAMINAGNIEDAQSLISQYEQLCPNDPEINEIKTNL